MKKELYCYSKATKDNGLKEIPAIILMSIFLLPIILSNIIWGLILPCAFFLLYFFIKRESDIYNRNLLKNGLFLLFLGIEFCSIILILYDVIVFFVITIPFFIIIYEISWIIKIKQKMYSHISKEKNRLSSIISAVFGGTGVMAGRLIAKNVNTDLKLWIGGVLSSLLIVYSLSFFQKYFINKIFCK